MVKLEISLNKQTLKKIQILADAKQVTIQKEIENILNKMDTNDGLIGMPDIVGTEIKASQLQNDGLVKINGVLYFYYLVGCDLNDEATYVVSDMVNQRVDLVIKGENNVRN